MENLKCSNFSLVNCDTDSIMVCFPDGQFITELQRKQLLSELNSLYPETIRWEDDGYFSKVLILKAKNYILKDEKGKIKIKGSALKSSKTEKAIKEFMMKLVDHLLNDDCYDKMIFECFIDNHGFFEKSSTHFKSGQGCQKCSKNS
mgnify:CR=1 FL=1